MVVFVKYILHHLLDSQNVCMEYVTNSRWAMQGAAGSWESCHCGFSGLRGFRQRHTSRLQLSSSHQGGR